MADSETTSASDHSVTVGESVGGSIFNIHYEETHLLDSAPKTPPQVPHLHRLVGRQAEKQTLLDMSARVEHKGRGTTVFLMGEEGSGRHVLTGWILRQALARGHSAVAARFWDPDLLTDNEGARIYWAGSAMEEYGNGLANAYRHSGDIAGIPWLNLTAQLAEQVGMREVPKWPDDPVTLNRFVRRTARDRPLILALEHLHWADSIWIELLRWLADEVAQDLPVLLLVTLEAPVALEWLSDDNHTEPTRLVETLVADGIGRAIHLERVATGQFIQHLGPLAKELGDRLRHLAGDEVLVAEMIWEEWVAQGAIEQDSGGMWRINRTQEVEWWVYGDVRDHARAILGRCLENSKAEPSFDIAAAERLLNCAAVEGRVFTAPAVAKVMEVDSDDLIDFFDECLVVDGDQKPDAQRSGILIDLGTPDSRRPLWSYCFAEPYLYHVWAKYPHLQDQRRRWSKRLAEELEQLYHPETSCIANKLIDLFRAGGVPERASAYYRRREQGSSLMTLRWHVRVLVDTTPDDDRFGTHRLLSVGLELLNRLPFERPDLWEEGAWLAAELARRSELINDVGRLVSACYLGSVCYDTGGHFGEALSLAQRAVSCCESSGRRQSGLMATCLSHLGLVLSAQGDPAGAREIQEQALVISEAVRGPEHKGTASILGRLGNVLAKLEDFAGAQEALERAIAIQKASPDFADRKITEFVANLGFVLRCQGKMAEARKALEWSLASAEAIWGPEHPDVAGCLQGLGKLLLDLGELEAAQAQYERAISIVQNTYGPHHPDLVSLLSNLGIALAGQGKLTAQQKAFEQALAIEEASSAPRSHVLKDKTYNLGVTLADMGELEGAREAFERALGIMRIEYGPEHPSIAGTLSRLGLVLQKQGNLSGARATFEQSYAVAEAVYGPEHPEVATALDNLGSVLLTLDDLIGARDALKQAMVIDETREGRDHPQVGRRFANLGSVFFKLDDMAAAQAAYQQALSILEKTLGQDHPNTAKTLYGLGLVAHRTGENDKARRYMEDALAILHCHLPPDDPTIETAEACLAELAEAEERLEPQDSTE